MSIISNRAYSDPNIARIAQNLSGLFAPPSAGDTANYAKANALREDAARRAELYQLAQATEGFDQGRFDRMGVAAGLYNPNQSYYSVDQGNATQRYGYDRSFDASRLNNADNNERAMMEAILKAATDPVAEGAVRPGFNPTDYGVESVPAVPEFGGREKPLSETQWEAQQRQRLLESGQLTDEMIVDTVLGERSPVKAVGPDGREIYATPGRATREELSPAPDGGKQSAAEAQIGRLTDNFLATGVTADPTEAGNLAVGIVDGRYRVDRHPVTGVSQVVDIATGAVVKTAAQTEAPAAPAPEDPAAAASAAEEFGPQYPNANDAFGVGGAATGLVNTIMDTAGVGAPYPEVQQSQADFGVLRESLLNDIGSTYGRQPPSWLLKEIRDLTPAAGSVFEGAGGAQSKLNALGRHLAAELQNTQAALARDLSPTNQQEMEARAAGLQMGIQRVRMALQAFGPPSATPDAATAPEAAPAAEGAPVYATNPTTGERLQLIDGQWVPAQ